MEEWLAVSSLTSHALYYKIPYHSAQSRCKLAVLIIRQILNGHQDIFLSFIFIFLNMKLRTHAPVFLSHNNSSVARVVILHSQIHSLQIKVQLLWEGHKSLWNHPHGLDIYLVNVQTMRKIAQIFLAFSEKLNFTNNPSLLQQILELNRSWT